MKEESIVAVIVALIGAASAVAVAWFGARKSKEGIGSAAGSAIAGDTHSKSLPTAGRSRAYLLILKLLLISLLLFVSMFSGWYAFIALNFGLDKVYFSEKALPIFVSCLAAGLAVAVALMPTRADVGATTRR